MHCLPSRHQLHIVVEAAFTFELDALARVAEIVQRQEGPSPESLDADKNF